MCFSWTFSRLPSIHDFWIFCAEINWSFSLILHHLFKYLSFVNPSLNTTLDYVAFSTASRDPTPPCPAWRLQATLLYLFTGVTCSCPRAVFAECCFRITCVKSSGKGIPIAHSWRMILALLTWGFWESVLFSPLFLCHTTFENCGLKSISVKIKIQLNFFFLFCSLSSCLPLISPSFNSCKCVFLMAYVFYRWRKAFVHFTNITIPSFPLWCI